MHVEAQVVITADGGGLGLGLIVAALLLGMRHGVDWDHIAAITDITATQDEPRRGLLLGTLYAAGHAAVVFFIGVGVIVAGRNIPAWADVLMGRVVGWTLILLGLYLVYSLAKFGQDFAMRSRWMLVLSAIRRSATAVRTRRGQSRPATTHEHPHAAAGGATHEHEHTENRHPGRDDSHVHTHRHTHDAGSDAFTTYGTGTSVGVGMLHGIGAETPTQVVVFLAAASAGGTVAGVTVLGVFLFGLFLSNSLITVASSFGFLAASRSGRARVVLGGVTAVMSLVVGILFVLGLDAALPAFFAG